MTDPEDLDLEAPEADAAEQAREAAPTDEYDGPATRSSDIEAPEWDTLEQAQTVELEDDYR
jgi:hypothetical protein